MKKSVKIALIAVLCVAVICLGLYAYGRSRIRINANRVEKITLLDLTTQKTVELSQEETAEFIKLFNKAAYKGQTILGETTPDYTAYVHYQDGTVWSVSEDISAGRNFEVNRKGTNESKPLNYLEEHLRYRHYRFYLYSEPLEEWILAFLAK